MASYDATLFQFHEGPIKTLRDRVRRKNKSSFNSMKVRLKLFAYLVELTWKACFNSMKVRLKPK